MHQLPPPTTLRTHRCHVRPLQLADALPLTQAVQDSWEHLDRWVGVGPRLESEALAVQEIRRVTAEWWAETNFVLGVFDEDGDVIGGTGFHPRGAVLGEGTTEVGMWITEEHSGKGLATEVLRGMLLWGLTQWRWERIEWRCDAHNVSSAAVAMKAGMKLDGLLRSSTVDRRGERCDMQVFSMLRKEASKRDSSLHLARVRGTS